MTHFPSPAGTSKLSTGQEEGQCINGRGPGKLTFLAQSPDSCNTGRNVSSARRESATDVGNARDVYHVHTYTGLLPAHDQIWVVLCHSMLRLTKGCGCLPASRFVKYCALPVRTQRTLDRVPTWLSRKLGAMFA